MKIVKKKFKVNLKSGDSYIHDSGSFFMSHDFSRMKIGQTNNCVFYATKFSVTRIN